MQLKDYLNRVYFGDCRKSLQQLPAGIAHTCVTSPPFFGLRDYGTGRWEGGNPEHKHDKPWKTTRPSETVAEHRDVQQVHAREARSRRQVCSCGAVYVDEQIGMEKSPDEYVEALVEVFREVRRVLRDDGTVWLNLGDSYAGGTVGYSADAPSNQKRLEMLAKGERKDGAFGISKRNAVSHTGPQRRLFEGIKPKDLIGIPWLVAFALRADGWYLRNDIIWNKPNPMPESIEDRPTRAHEYIFLLSKSRMYYYDADAIKEPSVHSGRVHKLTGAKGPRAQANGNWRVAGNERPDAPPIIVGEYKNKRDVWTVNAQPYSGAHFATYPEDLIEPCILAGSPERGVVLDPFIGSGTTAAVAARLTRYWIGCELNDSHAWLQAQRLGRTWDFEEPRSRVNLDEGSRVRVRL
jgi:DNA modification methylase